MAGFAVTIEAPTRGDEHRSKISKRVSRKVAHRRREGLYQHIHVDLQANGFPQHSEHYFYAVSSQSRKGNTKGLRLRPTDQKMTGEKSLTLGNSKRILRRKELFRLHESRMFESKSVTPFRFRIIGMLLDDANPFAHSKFQQRNQNIYDRPPNGVEERFRILRRIELFEFSPITDRMLKPLVSKGREIILPVLSRGSQKPFPRFS